MAAKLEEIALLQAEKARVAAIAKEKEDAKKSAALAVAESAARVKAEAEEMKRAKAAVIEDAKLKQKEEKEAKEKEQQAVARQAAEAKAQAQAEAQKALVVEKEKKQAAVLASATNAAAAATIAEKTISAMVSGVAVDAVDRAALAESELEREKAAKAKEAVRVTLLKKEQEDAKMQAEEKLRQAARSVALLKEQEEASRLAAAAKEEEKEKRRVAAKLLDIAEKQEEQESRYALFMKDLAEKAKVRDREKAKLAAIMLSRNIRQLSAEAKTGMKSGMGGFTTTGRDESAEQAKVMEDSASALDAVKEKTSWAEAENNARPAYVSKKDADRNARQALMAKNKEEGGRLALIAEKKALEKEKTDMLKKQVEEGLNEKVAAVARKEAEKTAILAVENELAEIAKAEALALQMSSSSTVQKELDMNQSAFTIESEEE